jgi:hypothetical protein
MPMDIETFNLVVRKNMFDDIQMVKNQRGIITKHYLDLKFWVSSYIHHLSLYIHTIILLITLFNYFICIIDNYGFWTTSGLSEKIRRGSTNRFHSLLAWYKLQCFIMQIGKNTLMYLSEQLLIASVFYNKIKIDYYSSKIYL